MNRVRILAGCLLLAVCGLQGWTQHRAYQLGYHPALGAPLWQVQAFRQRHALYPPWGALVWAWRWGGTAMRVQLAGGVLGSGVLLGAVLVGTTRRTRTQPPPMQGHGTTTWATRRDVRQAGLFARRGLVLGAYQGRVLRFDGPENVLLVGPQRAGKGTGVIIPSLLELHEHTVVIDVRGETWRDTAGHRQTFYRCLRLALTQPGSVRFNPLAAIRTGTPYAFMDAALLGDMCITGGHNKPDLDSLGAHGEVADYLWDAVRSPHADRPHAGASRQFLESARAHHHRDLAAISCRQPRRPQVASWRRKCSISRAMKPQACSVP